MTANRNALSPVLGVLALAGHPAAAEETAAPAAVTLPEVTVEASGQPPPATDGYTAYSATTATKTDTPLIETPVSVAVVPSAVLEDQKVNRLQEALENVSGVRSNNNDVEGYVYKLRGFTSLNLFRNGLALPLTIATIQEAANLESVEVLKGPASVLFGRIDPGGVINLVTKKPQFEPAYALEQEVGSYDFYRTTLDATGPLGDAVAYRVIGAFQDYDSFRDFQGGRRTFLAPSAFIRLGADTDLLVEGQYLRNDAQSDTTFLPVGDRPAPIPFSRSFQESNDPLDKTRSHNLGYSLEHRFDDDWKLNNRFLYSRIPTLDKRNVVPGMMNEATGDLPRTVQYQMLDGTVHSTNLDLTGRFDAFGAEHKTLMGLDYLHDYIDYAFAELDTDFPINIYAPVYGTIPDSAYAASVRGTRDGGPWHASGLVKQLGFYLQDQMQWGRWHLLLGGRYDIARLDRGSGNSVDSARDDRNANPAAEDREFTPRAGILYDLTDSLSIYASRSESFGQNNSGTGSSLPPEKGVQYEIGTKALLGESLAATLAVYELTKSNLATPDLSTPDPDDSRLIGEARSRGVEIDLGGRLLPRLDVAVAYAYTDGEYTRDNRGLEGKRFDNVPKHAGKLSLAYDFGDGDVGWRVGGGIYAADQVAADQVNSAFLPGYARIDGFAAYAWHAAGVLWRAQFNVHNLLDREYFDGSDIFYNHTNTRAMLFPAQPRTALLSLRAEF